MKKAVLFSSNGFEEIEALTVVDILRRAGIKIDICSIEGEMISGAHNINVKSDTVLNDININEYDIVVLPGGMPGATNLRDNEKVIKILKDFNDKGKIIAAICAAPIVLAKAGIILNRTVTSYPGFEEDLKDGKYIEQSVVQHRNIITSRGPGTAMKFAFKILENLIDKNLVEKLKESMLYVD